MKPTAVAGLLALGLAATGCSGQEPPVKRGSSLDGATITADETWSGTKELSGQITIEAGAQLHLAKDTFVTVKGSLVSKAAERHAKLGGEKWGGLVVAQGGVATLAGLELDNAVAALDVQGGTATFEDGTITWAGTPFRVLEGASLVLRRAVVANASGLARVKGSLVAQHLTMDTLADTGIQADAIGAKVDIEDSRLMGHGAPTDVIVATAGSVHVRYTDISEAHCGVHFWNANEIDISHVTIHDVSYGGMLYGSTSGGTLAISDSNIEKTEDFGVHEAEGSQNGPLALRNVWFGENVEDTGLLPSSHITIQRAGARITNAGPRD